MSISEPSMNTDSRNFVYPVGVLVIICLALFFSYMTVPVRAVKSSTPTAAAIANLASPTLEPTATKREFATATLPLPTATATAQAVALTTSYDPTLVALGQQLFTLCAACHGPDAKGVTGLGKDLTTSEFVKTQTDEELVTFIKKGRASFDPANTTGIDMPPKGGNPALKDEEITAIVAYVRSLASGSSAPVAAAAAAATATPTLMPTFAPYIEPTKASQPAQPSPTAVAVAAAGDNAAQVARGQQLFTLCAACHGPDAKGVTGLGKDLTTSEFVKTQTDEELVAFVKKGRPSFDPANTTGIDMPPKGGNPALKDEEITAIVAYVRSLQDGTN